MAVLLSAADTTRGIAVGAGSVALKETRDAIVEPSVPPQLDLEFCQGAARFFRRELTAISRRAASPDWRTPIRM